MIMKGLGTALITPFTEDGKVDFQSLSNLIEHQVAGAILTIATRCVACCGRLPEEWEYGETHLVAITLRELTATRRLQQ
mgnify:CR=1 FL=1